VQHLKILFATTLFALLCLADSDAKVVYVQASAPAGGNGTSWVVACRHLQDALDLTVAGDEVWVAAGTYYADRGAAVTTGDRTATFTLKQDVKLYGGFSGVETYLIQRNPVTNPTILSGEIWAEKLYWSLHLVTLAGNATLDGFTVTKGNANGESSPHNVGAGIYCPVANKVLTLANCMITDNTSNSSGGAIYSASDVAATNCTFSGNTASSGGAILSSSVTATYCTFSGNTVFSSFNLRSGAIDSSSVTVSNCKFSNNTGRAIRSSSSVTAAD
jgi:predicted outer membrane repeat protein